MSWIVNSLMWGTSMVSYPIALILDKILGEDHAVSMYRRSELKALVALHAETAIETARLAEEFEMSDNKQRRNSTALTLDEVTIIQGALDLKNKTVKDAMTPWRDVFMLPADIMLDKETLASVSFREFTKRKETDFFFFFFF